MWAGDMDVTPQGAVHIVGVPIITPQDYFFYYRKRPGQKDFETLRVPFSSLVPGLG